ncbi:hypothetical protein Goshw_012344 [Gossypium schwendimanii]|uniref:RNase H type-1 domain-containing protein n=1 Tax=Gossypium schwendimanii TaxID=34291 RepID=A0A7J9M2X8_GOSSC|nr:hypothetical protein [Gossypium schwendimanii]
MPILVSLWQQSCTLEFDGASKGNPGPAGAAAVLKTDAGNVLQGLWKVKHEHMSELCEQAMKLKDKFLSFQINHVLRELNGEADAEANLAVKLAGEKVKSRRSWPNSLIVLAEVQNFAFKPQKIMLLLAFKLSSSMEQCKYHFLVLFVAEAC